MYENLLAQPASNLLVQDIRTDKLPPSILFSGESASGKLTAALETARILSCLAGSAVWTCPCASCQKHRLLIHPDLLLAGPKDCLPEIRAASQAFLRNGQAASRFLFIRSVRKLVLRFDPAMYEGDETRYARSISSLGSIAEDLEDFELLTSGSAETAVVEKKVASIVNEAEKLETGAMYEAVPVSMIRKIASWSHLAPYGKKKIVIIERADRMQDSARNAFLKILEEPPRDVVFILTTSRRGAILPTILSRVRTYGFISRPMDVQQSVITRVFHDTPLENETLDQYFSRFLPVPPEKIRETAAGFVQLVLREAQTAGRIPPESIQSVLADEQTGDRSETITDLVASLNKCKPDSIWRRFLVSVTAIFSRALREQTLSPRDSRIYAEWNSGLREALLVVDTYNLSPVAALEKLSVEMRNAL